MRFLGEWSYSKYLEIWVLCFVCLLLIVSAVNAGYQESDNTSSSNLQKVTLQVRWDHQYQFAGYYAAKWNGYYRDAGFDVYIRSAITQDGKILSATEEVGNGTADFGVGAADILLARDKGIPLVVLASIFQQSASEFYARNKTRLYVPFDLLNLKVARNVNDLIDVELQAMLQSEGINPNNITAYPHFPGIQHLVDDRVDVIPGYRISAPFEFQKQGLETKVLRPIHYGIDFYGDSLFTTRKRVDQDSEAADRFTQASIKGWEYALEHPEEIADKISQELPRMAPIQNGTFREFNRFQMNGVKELTLYPIIDVGHVNPDRWRRMNELMQNLGIIQSPLSIDEFVFDPVKLHQKKEKEIFLIFMILIFGTTGGILIIYGWTLYLRKTIALKTREIQEVNSKLDQDIEILREAEEKREHLLHKLAKNHDELINSYQDLETQKEKLQTSEEQYRTIVTNSQAGYFLIDNEGLFQMVNDAWLSMHGFSSIDEVIGQHFLITQIEEDTNKAWENVDFLIRGCTINRGEFRRRNRDGSIGYHTFSATPVIHDGIVVGLEGFLIDITERKQMEESLRKSEHFLRGVLNATPNLIYIYNLDEHRNVYANREIVDFLGYSSEQILTMGSKLFDSILYYDDAQKVAAHHSRMKSAMDNEILECEYRMKHANGTWRLLRSRDIVFTRNQQGIVQEILGSADDVTEKNLSELRLKEAFRYNRGLIEASIDPFVTINPDGKITDVNSASEEITGYTREELIGTDFSEYFTEPQKARVGYLSVLDAGLLRNYPLEICHKDGRRTPVLYNASVYFSREGVVQGVFAAARDITERKKAEESLREANQKLRLLTGLTRHDIFNQLSVIQNLHDFCLNSSDLIKIHEYISRAQIAGNQLEATIRFTREYENFGFISSGWLTVYQIIESAQTEVTFATVILQNRIPETLEVYADPIIRKVFSTLMENSIRHGGKITNIQFSDNKREDILIITCEDDGIGIPSEEKERIFDHGYGKHTGIGLFLAREILSITGLSIRECGEPGKGARFEILVPAGKFRHHTQNGGSDEN